ncbi:Aldo/keto reductase family protein [compost metagenome]
MNDKGLKVLNALDQISAKYEVTQASVALAWLLANPLVTAPIVSATSESQLKTLFAAPEVRLSSEDIISLNDVSK